MSSQPPSDGDLERIFAAHRAEFEKRLGNAETLAGLVHDRPEYAELAATIETVTALGRLLLERADGSESFIELEKDLDAATAALGIAALTAARRDDQRPPVTGEAWSAETDPAARALSRAARERRIGGDR